MCQAFLRLTWKTAHPALREDGQEHEIKIDCGGLNKNGPHRLTYLNARFPVVGTVW